MENIKKSIEKLVNILGRYSKKKKIVIATCLLVLMAVLYPPISVFNPYGAISKTRWGFITTLRFAESVNFSVLLTELIGIVCLGIISFVLFGEK